MDERKTRRQAHYEKYGPKIVSRKRVRKGEGEFVRACVNLQSGQYEEYYRILLSGTLVKVCRRATEAELKEEKRKQQDAIYNRMRQKYLAILAEKEKTAQASAPKDEPPIL